jgi:hypothetical protein
VPLAAWLKNAASEFTQTPAVWCVSGGILKNWLSHEENFKVRTSGHSSAI